MNQIIKYDPSTTALLVVDPLNDFLSPFGKMRASVSLVIKDVQLFTKLKKAINIAHGNDFKVVYAPHYRYDRKTAPTRKFLHPSQFGQKLISLFSAKGYGGKWHRDFVPEPTDIIASEHPCSSGFLGTNLHELLQKQGITNLVIAGMLTNTCIESTARTAIDLGYQVTILSDSVITWTRADQIAGVQYAYPVICHEIMTVSEFQTALNNVHPSGKRDTNAAGNLSKRRILRSMFNRMQDRANLLLMAQLLKRYRSSDIQKTALVLLDTKSASLASQQGLRDRLVSLVNTCRDSGLTVIYSNFGEQSLQQKPPAGVQRLLEDSKASSRDFNPELAPKVGDIVLEPRETLSVFFNKTLNHTLKDRGIEHLVFAGSYAELSIQSSARHSSENGFHTTVLEDCCGSMMEGGHAPSMRVTLPRLVHEVLLENQWLKIMKLNN